MTKEYTPVVLDSKLQNENFRIQITNVYICYKICLKLLFQILSSFTSGCILNQSV